jgi:hypothetical protein
MSQQTNTPSRSEAKTFSRQAERPASGLLRELFDFLRLNKKWWLTPIVLVLLLVGALAGLGSTAIAPFIYTLF